MSRIFIFIDESGDAGNHEHPSSSQYYQLNIVVATREMLWKIALGFSRFRYFTDAEKEIDKYLRWEKTRKIITDIFSMLACNVWVHFLAFRIEKQRYIWPYYNPLDSKKFRNFIIRMALEKTYLNVFFPTSWSRLETISDAESVEIVVDRFLDNPEDARNLEEYLKWNYNLKKILHITQIDSEYSEHMQCTDVLGKIIKKHIENNGKIEDLNFVEFFDISDPHYIRRIPEEPAPF